MKAIVVSFFKSNNIGDLLISYKLSQDISKVFNNVLLYDYSSGCQISKKNLFLNNLKIDYELKTTMKVKKRSEFKKFIPLPLLKKIIKTKYFLKKNSDFSNKFDKNSVLIIGGGNMVFDDTHLTLSAAHLNWFISRIDKNIPKFAISIGIGPFKNDVQLNETIKTLNKFDYITFRDQKSYKLVSKYLTIPHENIKIAPDPVFFLEKQIKSIKIENQKVIGINIINNPVFRNDTLLNDMTIKYYKKLIDLIIKNTSYYIKVFSTDSSDYEVIDEILQDYNHERIKKVTLHNAEEAIILISNLDLLIATRMHSAIIAFSQGVPCIGLAWQHKMEAMFELMNLNDYCFDILNSNLNSILIKIQSLNYELIIEKIDSQLKKLQLLYDVNIKFLEEMGE